eukprot:357436_1
MSSYNLIVASVMDVIQQTIKSDNTNIVTNSTLDTPKEYSIGERVNILDDNKNGIIRYIGKIKGDNGKIKKEIFYGIELNKPKGNTDGFINGQQYFFCNSNCGLFVTKSRLSKIITDNTVATNQYINSYKHFIRKNLNILLSYLDSETILNFLSINHFQNLYNSSDIINKQFCVDNVLNIPKNINIFHQFKNDYFNRTQKRKTSVFPFYFMPKIQIWDIHKALNNYN